MSSVKTWRDIPTIMISLARLVSEALPDAALEATAVPAAWIRMERMSQDMKIHVYSLGGMREWAGEIAKTMCLRVRYMPAARKAWG